MTTYYNQHTRMLVSVDCIIFGFNGKELEVLIGKRQMNPGRGLWSLYGGFVNANESLEEAANRTILELTGMSNLYMRQVGAYGDISRDPGDRVISVAYCALINVQDYDETLLLKYGLEWRPIDELPEMYSDHNIMIHNAIEQLRRRIKKYPISFNLLPESFTLTQLQHVFEAVLGEQIDKRNFRKRIKDLVFIQPTNEIDYTTSRSGAMLYRFDKEKYQEDPNFKI